VLFDNEEMIRHFASEGLKIEYAIDFFVGKNAPTLRKWVEQRARQAYEDFPLRAKTIFFASLLPLLILLGLAGLPAFTMSLAGLFALAVALAAKGRSRGEAANYFSW